jgi:hypothetical protein
MKKTAFAIIALFFCSTALEAGILRVASFPVRHPVQFLKPVAVVAVAVAEGATFPIRHPKRFWVNTPVDTPLYRLAGITWTLEPAYHGPTLPPDPLDDPIIKFVSIEGTF